MSHCKTCSGLRSSSMIKKRITETLKPARKTRTTTRRPKFLSLRLQLSSAKNQRSGDMTTTTTTTATATISTPYHHRHQLNLFPLHPENLVEDKETQDENMAYLFSSADGSATTLTGLIGAAGTSSEEGNTLSPSSLTYTYGEQDSGEGELVRTAMRNKERDASEDKWVSYSEVVERKDEEVSSCAANLQYKIQKQRLSLKLDYQEILNSWPDKSPLYIHSDSPQTVPDLHDDLLGHHITNDGRGSNGGLWSVPEIGGSNENSMKMDEGGEQWKMRHREASVLRYKKKRDSRLFAKRIRYEVRKLNAEKRPRIKGRFVKRN